MINIFVHASSTSADAIPDADDSILVNDGESLNWLFQILYVCILIQICVCDLYMYYNLALLPLNGRGLVSCVIQYLSRVLAAVTLCKCQKTGGFMSTLF